MHLHYPLEVINDSIFVRHESGELEPLDRVISDLRPHTLSVVMSFHPSSTHVPHWSDGNH